MKINYLLYSVAFASAFAACSDELTEAVNAPVNDAVAGRPSAGNVVLNISNGVQTRFDMNTNKFEDGDRVKLFLMDEFNIMDPILKGEQLNANMTPWKNQEYWFTMYDMQDYVSSNYIYTKEGSNFKNLSAQLVEGNYIAFFQNPDSDDPKKETSYRSHEITNRQDLWAYVNPKMELDKKAANVYANNENDIYLDYQQVYRNDDADPNGNLVMDMRLKPIMNRVKFTILNLNNAPYMIRRISIKRVDQQAVPTIAYIRPASQVASSGWNNEVMNDDLLTPTIWDNTDKFTKNTITVDYTGTTETYYTYNGRFDAFTQEDARAITFFETTANGKIPYGLKKEFAAPAFEYTVEFPDGGHKLNAHAAFGPEERVDVYVALPVYSESFYDAMGNPLGSPEYEIRVDGDYWDGTKGDPSNPGEWVPGYWSNVTPSGYPNTKWKMEKAFEHDWIESLGPNWPAGSLSIDFNDMHLYAEETGAVTVSSTAELINVLKADNLEGKVTTQIELNGIGIEFNDEVKTLIEANEKAIADQNIPGKEYSVIFTVNKNFEVEGEADSSDEYWHYYNSGYADVLKFINDKYNMNTVLVVTAEDVLGLPTNINEVSALFVADQKVADDYTVQPVQSDGADNKVFFAGNVNVADDVTFEGNGLTYILNGVTIDLNKSGKMQGVIIPQSEAVVTVKGGAASATTAKFAGENHGKVILPRADVYHLDLDGNEVYDGFNHMIDDQLLNNNNAVKCYPATTIKTTTSNAAPLYDAVPGCKGKNYAIVNSAAAVEDTTPTTVFAPVDGEGEGI